MRKLPLNAKKVISVIVAIGMIISLFSCMSGLSAFAIDNTPSPENPVGAAIQEKAPAIVAETSEKGETKSSDKAKNEGTHAHCKCGAVEGVAGTGVTLYGGHTKHSYQETNPSVTTYAPLSQADINAGTAIDKDGKETKFTVGTLPTWNCWYLTEDVTISAPCYTSTYDFYFCFNGHTITFTGKGPMFTFKGATAAKTTNFCTCDLAKNGGITVTTGVQNETNGGIFCIQQSNFARTFCLFNGKYDLGSSAMPSSGGVIYVGNDTSGTEVQNIIQLYEVELCGSPVMKGQDGGLINVRGGSKVTTYGGTYHNASVGNTKTAETHGALVSVWDNANFTSWGGTFSDGSNKSSAALQGGLFYVKGNGSIKLSSGTFTGSACANGGVVYATGSSTVTIDGGNSKLIGATVTSCGGAVAMYDSSILNMSNGTIDGGVSAYGGSVYLGGTATANISGGTIKAGNGKSMGGGVHVSSGCTLNVSGTAKITGGQSSSSGKGGSISLPAGSKCYITGGTIEKGWATNWGEGGCIYALNATAFEMSGGVISAGYTAKGGNVFIGGTTNFKFSGGEIKDGYTDTTRTSATAGGQGGNMHIAAGATLTMSGTAKISGGTAARTTSYAYSYGANIYNLGTINISGGTIEGGEASSSGGSIWSSGPINISEAKSTEPTTITGGVAGGYGGNIYTTGTFTMTGGSILNGESKSQGNEGAGNLYLLGNNNVISGGLVSGGFGVTWARGGNIHLDANKSLEISGSAVIKDGKGGEGCNIYTDAGSTLVIKGSAQVLDGTNFPERGSDCHGGNIYNQGALTISESAIISGGALTTTKDKGLQGGNIYSITGSLTINGGTVKDGSAKLGGNIFVTGQFIMTDGVVDNGYASSTGGGNIFASSTNAVISGGTIKNGRVSNWADGGNIYVDSDKSLTISGTALIDNGFAGRGGNIYLASSADVTMENGTVQKGHSDTVRQAESMGGNVYVGNNASFTMNNGIIKDGVTYGRGGNVCIVQYIAASGDKAAQPCGYFRQNGGTIKDGISYNFKPDANWNKAAYGGGNIYVGGVYKITGGELSGGKFLAEGATNNGSGGNISAGDSSSSVIIEGGVIKNGVAIDSNQTGNISIWYLAPANAFKMSGGKIINDQVDKPEKGNLGGTRVIFSSSIDKVFEVSGDAEIEDILTIQNGCHIKILEGFTGHIKGLTTNNKSGVIGKDWGADYITSGQVTTNIYYYLVYNEGNAALVLKSEADAIIAANEVTSVGDVDITNKNDIINAGKASDIAKELYNFDNKGDIVAEAQQYDLMMNTDVAVETNFGAEGAETLYIIYSAMDSAHIGDYHHAEIFVKINGIQVSDRVDDAFKSVIYSGDPIATAEGFKDGNCTKADYIYFTSVALTDEHAASDTAYEFYVRIYLDETGENFVDGAKKSGKLSDLLPQA